MTLNEFFLQLNFQNLERFILLAMSIFAIAYSLFVVRDLMDLQSHYESKLEPLFMFFGVCLFIASVFLLLFSLS